MAKKSSKSSKDGIQKEGGYTGVSKGYTGSKNSPEKCVPKAPKGGSGGSNKGGGGGTKK